MPSKYDEQTRAKAVRLVIDHLHRSVELAQYTSMHLTETLHLHGLSQSVGTVGDAYDTRTRRDHHRALQDRMHPRRLTSGAGPLTGLSTLEAITADWVHWYNTTRLMHRLDRPPAEAEAHYYARTRNDQPVARITEGASNPRRFK
jgi:putative transposase